MLGFGEISLCYCDRPAANLAKIKIQGGFNSSYTTMKLFIPSVSAIKLFWKLPELWAHCKALYLLCLCAFISFSRNEQFLHAPIPFPGDNLCSPLCEDVHSLFSLQEWFQWILCFQIPRTIVNVVQILRMKPLREVQRPTLGCQLQKSVWMFTPHESDGRISLQPPARIQRNSADVSRGCLQKLNLRQVSSLNLPSIVVD